MKQANLLLIEDNPGDARLVKMMLGDIHTQRFIIDSATTMKQAQQYLAEKQYDVVLTDLSLPDSSGLNTVTQICEIASDATTVVMTGIEDEELEQQIVQAGAQGYLVKGEIDSKILARSIRHAMERNRLIVELRYAKLLQEKIATHDPLTGMPNRILFMDRLEQYLALAERESRSIALLFIDLDRFKLVNDVLGHHIGDKFLIAFSERLSSCLRASDTAARFGGDEFACLLMGDKGVSHATQIAEKIINATTKSLHIDGHEISSTSSIGIAEYPRDGNDADTLLKHADSAMYDAKKQGRACYSFFSADKHGNDHRRMAIEVDLRFALEKNEIEIFYQPILSSQDKNIVAVEALVRWHHPRFGTISPAEFIPVAESCGVMFKLGEWILHNACEQNKRWQQQGYSPIKVCVNLSAMQFSGKDSLVKMVKKVLENTRLAAKWLELEITESTSMQNPDATIGILCELRDIGVKISVDDFGTGYSSLSYLQRFPIDTLKVDRSFVKDVTTNTESAAIAKTIINLAQSLGLETVGEGVETVEQAKFLEEAQCTYLQGYLYSKPEPVNKLKLLKPSKKNSEFTGVSVQDNIENLIVVAQS